MQKACMHAVSQHLPGLIRTSPCLHNCKGSQEKLRGLANYTAGARNYNHWYIRLKIELCKTKRKSRHYE